MKRSFRDSAPAWALFSLLVIYFALVAASVYEEGMTVFMLVPRMMGSTLRDIHWTAYTPKFILIFLAVYAGGIALYYSTRQNRRPGEEHGSAQWGNALALNKKYSDKDPNNNAILTRHLSMSLNGRKHMRNLLQIIVGGSGNQGLTVSLPVIEYAKEYGKSDDELQRALAVANLCAIHQKAAIGKLSAFCGAVTAGSAAGAGIAYLLTKDCTVVEHTIVNALAIVSGMICDGAKPSCAAKISSAIDAAILGFEMFQRGHEFYGGDGILSKGIENTISNVGKLGREGMRETDRKILEIMTSDQ